MKKILVISKGKLEISKLLSEKYVIRNVRSCSAALSYLKTDIPDLILVDYLMPDISGIQMIKLLKNDEQFRGIPVIILASDNDEQQELEGLRLGAADYIHLPISENIINCRIDRIIEQNALQSMLKQEVNDKTEEIEKIILQSVIAVAKTVDSKDRYTVGHSYKVACYSEEIARRMKLSEEEIRNIHYISLLHDIGKIAIPDYILNKEGKYSLEEYRCMQAHTSIGAQILRGIKSLKNVGDAALCHHERYDGKGYPQGLKGHKIPLEARIISAADAFDAMKSDRPYRKKLSFSEIVQEINEGRGTQFDPEICDIVLKMMEDGFSINAEETATESDSTDIARESANLLQVVMNEYAEGYKIQANKDSLTGLWNRKYISHEVNNYLKNTKNYGALFMVDLDNFKNINDKFGHLAGDDILMQTGKLIEEAAGKDNIACRVGGDEFMIFIHGCRDKDLLSSIAEKLISNLNNEVSCTGMDYAAAASVGIAVAQYDGSTFSQLYGNADKALYLSKKKGKNTFQFYREDDDRQTASLNATREDLYNIRKMLREKGPRKGSYYVGYEGFKNIYQFLNRCVERSKQQVTNLLFTITDREGNIPDPDVLNRLIVILERSIKDSLRIGDVATQYSSSQIIVLLMDTDEKNGKMVSDRILNNFKCLINNEDINVICNTQMLTIE